MTAKPLLHTLLLAFAFVLAPACGGTEDDTSQAPDTEQADDALRPRPFPTNSSCSIASVTCRDAKGNLLGTSDGCSISCPSGQHAECYPGSCGTRIIFDASCGCFGNL